MAPRMQGIPTESKVIGLRDDPLSAYAAGVARHFPNGVPLGETGYARHLLRAEAAARVFPRENWPGDTGPSLIPTAPPAPSGRDEGNSRPIQQVWVEAFPVATQGTLDRDSLAIQVLAFDANGAPVSIRGTLHATLWGQNQKLIRDYGDHLVGVPGHIEKIGEWTQAVNWHAEERTPLRVVVALPATLPEHDARRFPLADLSIELLIPGRGVYSATRSNVALVAGSQLRDRLQQQTGSRYFPQETTSARQTGTDDVELRQSSSIRPDSRVFTVQP